MKRVSLYNLNFYLCVGRIMLVFSSTVGAHRDSKAVWENAVCGDKESPLSILSLCFPRDEKLCTPFPYTLKTQTEVRGQCPTLYNN